MAGCAASRVSLARSSSSTCANDSATALAAQLGDRAQRINSSAELEKAGLVRDVEERPRRGCTERISSSRRALVSPRRDGDRATAGRTRVPPLTCSWPSPHAALIDVAAMRERARAHNRRLVTFAIEADLGFEQPADIERSWTNWPAA